MENKLVSILQKYSTDKAKVREIAESVVEKYSEKQRVYHNLTHINSMLFHAQNLQEKFKDYESVQLAIWFHDAIYNTKRLDNETESAKFAVESLAKLKIPNNKIKKVEAMILATQKHDATGLDYDGKLFLDLDLGILGQSRENYQKYSNAIRKEYSFVPWFLYKRSRRKILEKFLQRAVIYYTEEIRQTYEANARLNIQHEIKELS